MRLRNLILVLAALTMVVVLAACSSAGQSSNDGAGGGSSQNQENPEEQAQTPEAPQKKMTEEAKSKEVAPQQGTKEEAAGEGETKVEPPEDNTLKLTVPKMAEIKNDTIPTGLGTNDALFRDYAAVHLKRTGFPWQETANVYIAGHRIGFPGTKSDMAFYDLEDLREGDTFYLTDAEGRRYNYKVFKKLIVEPTDLSVLRPIEGKNIVSLQTCTLPDYSDRVIYQAELQDIQT
ncbi:MAG: sortase [Actinomycetota bacterium]|nr:sortase [Actinomycetota bacterium]